MMQWNLRSNVCDVLGLGPRVAGLLATVGIRTVAELLAAKPQAVGGRLRDRSLTTSTITAWQCEAQLILALPELPSTAARLLAAVGLDQARKISQFTPTELLANFEAAQLQNPDGWLAKTMLPTVAEVGNWIYLAQASENFHAA